MKKAIPRNFDFVFPSLAIAAPPQEQPLVPAEWLPAQLSPSPTSTFPVGATIGRPQERIACRVYPFPPLARNKNGRPMVAPTLFKRHLSLRACRLRSLAVARLISPGFCPPYPSSLPFRPSVISVPPGATIGRPRERKDAGCALSPPLARNKNGRPMVAPTF